MASASYGRAVGLAALQAVFSSTWILARELSPAKRRLARASTFAAVTAVGYVLTPKPSKEATEEAEQDLELVVGAQPFLASEGVPEDLEAEPPVPFDKRKAALAVGAVALSVAAVVGRRQLEKRWLARLTRNGHPRPTRALAVRMAGVEFAGQLAIQFAEVHKERGQAGGSPPAS
jgi:hypothetical protein